MILLVERNTITSPKQLAGLVITMFKLNLKKNKSNNFEVISPNEFVQAMNKDAIFTTNKEGD